MTDNNHTDNAAASQRARILHHLQQVGPLTTLQARRLGICHPGMRLYELRKSGYQIETHWTFDATEDGSIHRVAKYVLVRNKQLALFDWQGPGEARKCRI
jgi:hypothetical protein